MYLDQNSNNLKNSACDSSQKYLEKPYAKEKTNLNPLKLFFRIQSKENLDFSLKNIFLASEY